MHSIPNWFQRNQSSFLEHHNFRFPWSFTEIERTATTQICITNIKYRNNQQDIRKQSITYNFPAPPPCRTPSSSDCQSPSDPAAVPHVVVPAATTCPDRHQPVGPESSANPASSATPPNPVRCPTPDPPNTSPSTIAGTIAQSHSTVPPSCSAPNSTSNPTTALAHYAAASTSA